MASGWFAPDPPPPQILPRLPPGTTADGNGPPPVVGPGTVRYLLRSLWPEESWQAQRGAQSASLFATPQVPPVPFSNALQSTLTQLWPQESWPAQRGPQIASLFAIPVNPPSIFPSPPYAQRYGYHQAGWPPEYWYAQSECGIAAGFAQLQLPALYTPSSNVAKLAILRALWPDESWPAQWRGALAGGWFQPLVTAVPTPPRQNQQWPVEDWPAQRGAQVAGRLATASIPAPYSNVALLYALRALWPDEYFGAQTGASVAAQFATPVAPYPFVPQVAWNTSLAWWEPERWPAQFLAPIGGVLATPAVPVSVPMILSQAIYNVINAGFEVAVQYAPSTTIPPGYVISQSIPAGDVEPLQLTVITLTVSSGPAYPSSNVTVPNTVGMNALDARTAIFNANLSLGAYMYQASAVLPGTVLSQTPAAGASALPGSIVQLTLSQGPAILPGTGTVPVAH